MVGVYFVYILASRPYGTLYIGVTNDIIARTYDHRSGEIPGFTKKYGVHRLVWFEQHSDINFAILREKRIKRWRREWKFNLIEETNPHWEDYYPKLLKAGWFATRDSVSRGKPTSTLSSRLERSGRPGPTPRPGQADE